MVTPPTLYRIARAIRVLGTLAVILVVVFVATAGYSASQLRPSAGSIGGAHLVSGSLVELSTSVNLSNRGFYALSHLTIEGQARLAGSNGTPVARGSSPVEDVPGGGHAVIPFSLDVALGSPGAASLLTHDARLPSILWVNGTFAEVFVLRLALPENLSWGAPFYGLNLTPGTPVPEVNGTVAFPFTLTFSNHAAFGLDGELSYTLRSAGGATCGTGGMAVHAPAGADFRGGSTAYMASGCDPRGGTANAQFTAATWAISLPPEPIP